MDPTLRVTTISAILGQLFMSLSIFGCQQNFVQRYCSMSSQSKVNKWVQGAFMLQLASQQFYTRELFLIPSKHLMNYSNIDSLIFSQDYLGQHSYYDSLVFPILGSWYGHLCQLSQLRSESARLHHWQWRDRTILRRRQIHIPSRILRTRLSLPFQRGSQVSVENNSQQYLIMIKLLFCCCLANLKHFFPVWWYRTSILWPLSHGRISSCKSLPARGWVTKHNCGWWSSLVSLIEWTVNPTIQTGIL